MMHRVGMVLLLAITACVVPSVWAAPVDSFNDGVIDSSQWVTGGAKRGWQNANTGDTGSWTYSVNETLIPGGDGYANMHVSGPGSSGTYGAEAWIMSTYDFNDGLGHLVNFTWEPIIDGHYDKYFIQLTDGYISTIDSLHWDESDPAVGDHTTDFLWFTNPNFGTVLRGIHLGDGFASSIPGKSSWSLQVMPTGVGRLYAGPNSTGTLLSTRSTEHGRALVPSVHGERRDKRRFPGWGRLASTLRRQHHRRQVLTR